MNNLFLEELFYYYTDSDTDNEELIEIEKCRDSALLQFKIRKMNIKKKKYNLCNIL
tara:strand:+ start:1420 stop:1587 length:168 start_codon:yes stop_codon:yes gene_type:complete